MALAAAVIIMVNRLYVSPPPPLPSQQGVERISKEALPPERPRVPEKAPVVEEIKEPREIKAPPARSIDVYFLRLNESDEKFHLVSVKRSVEGDSPLQSSMEALIRGPSSGELKKGYLSAVPGTLRVRRVTVNGKVATIDFSGAIEEGAAGNVLMHRLDQIVYTATQFDSIDSVIIMVDGKRRSSLGGDGLSISGPLHRR
jgi:spore germination protein GerM